MEKYYVRFLVIRHGQALPIDGVYGPNITLSSKGKIQAEQVAEYIKKHYEANAIYCSQIPRAVETAKIIANKNEISFEKKYELNEFELPPGPLENDPKKQLDKLLWKPEQRATANGETIKEYFQKVGLLCDEISQKYINKTLILVTHAGTIDAIMRWAVGIRTDEPWLFETEVGNGSITELEIWPIGIIEGGAPRYCCLKRIGYNDFLGNIRSDM
jgi:broad specificity phosphatase PhoE